MQDQLILALLKILVMVCFFLIVIVFGTLPLRSKNFKKRPLLKAIGATFAGCLFLNVAIMHILPQAADTLQDFLKNGDEDKQVFPLAYLFMMVGFIITVFFTKVLTFHSHQEDQEEEMNQDTESSDEAENQTKKIGDTEGEQQYNKRKEQLILSGKSPQEIKQSLITLKDENLIKRGENQCNSQNVQGAQAKKSSKKKKSKHAHTPHNHHHHSHGHNHGHDHHSHNYHAKHTHEEQIGITAVESGNQQPLLEPHHHHFLQNKSMLNQAFILTLAIYFHTIFEGIAIGVQDKITGFLSTAIAIAFHKWADALSMGCHYRTKNVQKKLSYTLIIIQAFLNVGSIGLGWIISNSGEVAQAIFLSISAGTFLAISTLQMLGDQLHHRQHMTIKFLLLLGATGFVASIWFIQNKLFKQQN